MVVTEHLKRQLAQAGIKNQSWQLELSDSFKKKKKCCIVLLRITPMGNSGGLPRGKPAATELHYPTYVACWMF